MKPGGRQSSPCEETNADPTITKLMHRSTREIDMFALKYLKKFF